MPRTFALRSLRALAALLAALAFTSQVFAQFGPDPRGGIGGGTTTNIFPLALRELRQNLSRAQAAVAEQRYSDAVQELSAILNSTDTSDFFLTVPGGGETAVSLKTEALTLLGSMPARGRKFYELQCGADAKQALEEALNAGDLSGLTEIGRRYFHTKAGYEATLILGRVQLDQGRPIAAALTLKRIAETPHAAAEYDPELSILLATCWLHANQPAKARETLLELKDRQPQGKIRLTDKEVPLFEGNALEWLTKTMGGPRAALAKPAREWVMYRGNTQRNSASLGGLALMNHSWKLPTVNDPPDEARVAQLYRSTRDKNQPAICSLQPLVVQDYAILRQPESNKLMGIHLKTGKRAWVFPPFDENPASAATQPSVLPGRGPVYNVRENELKQRIWEDHAFGQISSDGRQVYVIHELGFADSPSMNRPQVVIGRGGRGIFNNSGAKPYNTLVALDLAKQGYKVWEVGGTALENPELVNAFFLGAPLPAGDQLYALAEFAGSGEIRLVCLDARTGKMEWKQPLAILLEQLHIVNDRSRRLAGASPSLSDGVLVCPTSAGSVVAIDLSTRTLRWGYQYPRTDVRLTTQSRFGAPVPEASSESGRWLDATATLADGCVVLTPPESNQLHCLDLLSGAAKWPPQPRDEMLLVACVHKGKIILIGKNKMKAVHLADGSPAWKSELVFCEPGDTCTGRGYYSDNHYYVPVSGQRLLKIDLEAGEVAASAQTDLELGNLVCYQNELISQSPLSVASFVLMSDQLQRDLDERLAANAGDVQALAIKAQILLQEEKPDESLNLLRQAHKLAPESASVRSLLVKVMLALLQNDFDGNLGLADELDKLVGDSRERREVLRWRIQGLARGNRAEEAFRAILELADQELAAAGGGAASQELIAVQRGEHRVRLDRWLQGQAFALWNAADSDLQTRMSEEFTTRQKRAAESGSPTQLRACLNLFGFHPQSAPVRLALAERLLRGESWLEAELVTGELLGAADRATAGAARAVLAAIYEKSKRPELAARQYRELGAAFGDVVCRDSLTGQALAKQAAANPVLAPYFGVLWPRGKVEVTEHEASSAIERGFMFQQMVAMVPITHFSGAAVPSLRVNYDQQNMLVLRGQFGQPIATASLRTAERRATFAGGGAAHLNAAANGHLVLVNMGTEIVAVDGLRSPRSGDSLLWRQDTIDHDPAAQREISPLQRTSLNPLTGGRQVSYERDRKVSFQVAPVRGIGFCYQRGRQLICVDPLTGHSLWERGPIAPQAEIFGDGELIFVGGTESKERLVYRAIDGELLETKKLVDEQMRERAEQRWATHGRRVLAWEQPESTSPVKLRLYDAWDGRELWSKRVDPKSRGTIIDGDELALLEASGSFSIVSLADGTARLTAQLEPETTLTWIQVLRSQTQYVLMASQEHSEPGNIHTQPIGVANGQQSKLHGRVLAFDRETGKAQWPVPAFVSQHCLPAEQPVESPLLFFVRNKTDANKPAGSKASILVLDRRDGRIVYDNDVSAPANACDISLDPAKHAATLTLLSPTSKLFAFQLTEKPQPPEPPAQTGALSSLAVGQPRGILDRTVDAALELLPRGLLPTRRPPAGANP